MRMCLSNKKIYKTTLMLGAIICYLLLVVPYIVHTNLGDSGIVREIKRIEAQSMPDDIKDVFGREKESYTVLMVQDTISKRSFAVILTKNAHVTDSVVRVSDRIIDWHVDWHGLDFFGRRYDDLIVGEVQNPSATATLIETILSSRFGSTLFSISKAVFHLGALVLIIYISFLFYNRPALWNIPAVLTCYSFVVFWDNRTANLYQVVVPDMMRYFGYMFLILLPLTIKLWRYEESEKGREKLEAIWEWITSTALSSKK